jgi:hypothetical protein
MELRTYGMNKNGILEETTNKKVALPKGFRFTKQRTKESDEKFAEEFKEWLKTKQGRAYLKKKKADEKKMVRIRGHMIKAYDDNDGFYRWLDNIDAHFADERKGHYRSGSVRVNAEDRTVVQGYLVDWVKDPEGQKMIKAMIQKQIESGTITEEKPFEWIEEICAAIN